MWLLEQCSDAQQYSFSYLILAYIHLIVRNQRLQAVLIITGLRPFEKAKPEVYFSGNIMLLIAIMHNSLPRGEVSISVEFHFDKLHSMHLNLTTKLVKS